MRVTTRHVVLFVVLLATLTLAADTTTAAEAGTRIVDCFPSQGGGWEVCM